MELIEKGDWYMVIGAPDTVKKYLKYTVPQNRRYIEGGVWYVHREFAEQVRKLAISVGNKTARSPIVTEEPYAVLHLRPSAPRAIIDAAFRTLAKTLHPDVGGDAEEFKRVQAAYDKIIKG